MIAFINEQRGHYGVEPICSVLPVALSTDHEHVAQLHGGGLVHHSDRGSQYASIK